MRTMVLFPAFNWVSTLVPLFVAAVYLARRLWTRPDRLSIENATALASCAVKSSASVALPNHELVNLATALELEKSAPEAASKVAESSHSLEFLKDELERLAASHEQEKKVGGSLNSSSANLPKVLMARHAAEAEGMAKKMASLEGRIEALIIQHLQVAVAASGGLTQGRSETTFLRKRLRRETLWRQRTQS